MSTSKLFGSFILSFFLFSSLVANDNAADRIGEVIKAGDGKHPTSVVNTDKNPLDVIKAKQASDVIKRDLDSSREFTAQENGITNGAVKAKQGEVIKSSTFVGINGGVLNEKEGEVVKKSSISKTFSGAVVMEKEGEVVKKSSISNDNTTAGINGGIFKSKEGEVLRKDGTVFNKNYNRHSTFKINTRTEAVIHNDTRVDCPAGTVDDCSGDGDCCAESWIGDGFADCEDQPYGCDLTCYGDDGGDCAGNSTTTTTSGGGANLVASYNMTYDWYCSGSYGTAVVNFYDDYSADLEGLPGTWGFNSPMTLDDGLCAGDDLGEGYFFSFDNYTTTYNWDQTGCGYHDDTAYNGPMNADGVTVLYDFIDPAACYGDSGTTTTTTTTTTSGGGCPDGTVDDCSGDGDCCPTSWIGDGFEDCEDQAYGCDLTCYDSDGGDCGGGTTTTTSGGGANLIWSAPMSYDWYCTGSYGTATLNFYDDGSADLEGLPGTWFPNEDSFNMPDGLCVGGDYTPSVIFVFNNYTTSYAWETAGNGYPSDPGCGIQDDFGYNGQNVDGTSSLNLEDPSVCYDNATTTTTTTTSGGSCPDGTVDDCSGDGDCCAESWIGDGFADCEDQPYGCDLTCYGDDGGDCASGTTTTTSGGDANIILVTTMSYDWACTGTPGYAVATIYDDFTAYVVDDAGYGYTGTWQYEDASTWADGYCSGGDLGSGVSFMFDGSPSVYQWELNTPGDLASGGCGNHSTGYYGLTVDGTTSFGVDPATCYDNATTTTTSGGGECPAGTVQDCVDDDCCPESWIGDGFEDCEDQAYGCDLTCYDNDGGDCGGGTTTTTTTGGGNLVYSGTATYDWYCTGSYGQATINFYDDGSADFEGLPGGWDYTGPGSLPEGLCPASEGGAGFGFVFNNYSSAYIWEGDLGGENCGVHDDFGYNGNNVDGTSSIGHSDPSACYGDGGTTTTTTTTSGGGECPAGTVQDCVDDDCCPESWIGDGFEDCEDQAYGCDLTCYDNDGGDCGAAEACEDNGQVACHDLSCADTFEDCFESLGDINYTQVVTYDWACTGDPGTTLLYVWSDTGNDIGFVVGDNLWVTVWSDYSGGEVNVPAGDYCPEFTGNTDWGFFFNDFPWVNYQFECEDESNSICAGIHSFDGNYTVGGWSTSEKINPDECPDGFVDDCVDDDCCPESWIGDGFEDCEDQAFGCDLTCYDNDAGDCDDGTTTTTTTTTSGGGCPAGTVEDCVDDDCCPESWIGDGFEDCEDQAYGCDLTCYDNDGGDCDGGGGTTTTGGGNCDEIVWSTTMTYDWYCTGSPGSATMNLCANGTADLEGLPGTWMSGLGQIELGDGLCPGDIIDNDLSFMFDNYTTIYMWDTEGDDIYTPGSGYHDDFGYNGGDNVDGLTCVNGADCSFDSSTTTTTTTTSGGGCPDGTVDDCSGDGDCCPESWIGDGFEDCEDQAYGCDLTCYDSDGGDCGPDCAPGDVNCDGSIDVVDVVNMVNAIINGDELAGGDVNGDGSLDVVDVVLVVNYIIDGGARAMDADSATMTIANNSLRLSANGYIGGVQMTLLHSNGFELNLTDNAMVSEYKTTGTSTMLVVVAPEEELIFTANQSFEVVDMIVANSEVEIDVNTVSEFGLTAAYPNPFNPSTTVSLNVPSADFVSVKVYNLVGQVVGVLAEGMMDANSYTFTWNATDMSSGVYMIRAESGSKVDIQKVLLVK